MPSFFSIDLLKTNNTIKKVAKATFFYGLTFCGHTPYHFLQAKKKTKGLYTF